MVVVREFFLLLLLCPLLLSGVHAEALYESIGEITGADALQNALPEEERGLGGTLTLDGSYDVGGAVARLGKAVRTRFSARLRAELGAAVPLLGIALVCALSSALVDTGEMRALIDRAGCCAAALLGTRSLDSLLESAREILERFSAWSTLGLPAVFTAAAASGAIASASARYAAACLALDVLMTLSQRLALPLVCLYIALAVSLSLCENSILQALLDVSRWAVTTGLTVLTMAFGGYLSLTGLLAGSADALALKATKTVPRSLPVVGGLLSDSAGVLLSAASVVKNSLGVFALVSVCALCVVPLTLYAAKLLVYRAVAACVGFLREARLPALIGRLGTAFGMLLGLIGCNACMLFLAIVSGIRAAGPP